MSGSMVSLIERLLVLCKVEGGEKVVLLTGPVYDQGLVSQYLQALSNIGADFVHLISPPTEEGGKLSTAAPHDSLVWDILRGPKLVIGLTSVHPPLGSVRPKAPTIYSGTGPGSFYELLKSGARVLWISIPDPEHNMRRLFPTEDIIRRGHAGAQMMEEAKTIRITSEAGTDLTCDKTGIKGHCQVGVADVPGRWDNYGVYLVACSPKQDSANGTLVIAPGDYMPRLNAYSDFTEPVKLTFKDGYITKVEGGGQAKVLERWLNRTGEKGAKALAGHIGWGTNNIETSAWRDSPDWAGTPDYEGHHGIMQIHFGRNIFHSPAPHCGLMGGNTSPSHGGPSCRNTNFYLDDQLIVEKGVIVHPDCR